MVLLPQKTASFRTEMAIVDNGTLESRASAQFCELCDSARRRA